jgi:hypothetical protein
MEENNVDYHAEIWKSLSSLFIMKKQNPNLKFLLRQ